MREADRREAGVIVTMVIFARSVFRDRERADPPTTAGVKPATGPLGRPRQCHGGPDGRDIPPEAVAGKGFRCARRPDPAGQDSVNALSMGQILNCLLTAFSKIQSPPHGTEPALNRGLQECQHQ